MKDEKKKITIVENEIDSLPRRGLASGRVKRLVWTVFVMSGLRFHHLSSCVYAIEDIRR